MATDDHGPVIHVSKSRGKSVSLPSPNTKLQSKTWIGQARRPLLTGGAGPCALRRGVRSHTLRGSSQRTQASLWNREGVGLWGGERKQSTPCPPHVTKCNSQNPNIWFFSVSIL